MYSSKSSNVHLFFVKRYANMVAKCLTRVSYSFVFNRSDVFIEVQNCILSNLSTQRNSFDSKKNPTN